MNARRGSLLVRWLKRIGIGLLALIVLVVAGGSGYEAIARHRVAEDYPPNGRMIDIGGRSIHLDCRGTGSPTVVFESGLDMIGSLAWDGVHDEIATTTRACAYDRAGIMWSDPKAAPQNAAAVADDLHATLAAAGESAPFVLVGHSLGGPYAMTYTKKYGDQVAGLIFVDASHPDQVSRFADATTGPMSPTPSMRWVKIAADAAWTGVVRVFAPADGGSTPADVYRKVRAYIPTSLPSMLDELDALDGTLQEAGTFRRLGDRPVIALTASDPYSDEELTAMTRTKDEGADLKEVWKALHDEEASWSTRGRNELVPGTSHYIQFDRPQVVTAAVREVVASVRAPSTPFVTGRTTAK